MNRDEAKKRIGKLKEEISHHRYLYHVLDQQELSDAALDSLKKELLDLEQQFPEFITSDSPTQRVSGKALEKFEKVTHSRQMLSFNDAFSEKDMEDWFERVSKLLPSKSVLDYYCELKIDGLAISLTYENGIFQTGATRGDGKIGENVTQNLKTVEAIPMKLQNKEDVKKNIEKLGFGVIADKAFGGHSAKIEVRGEVFISKEDFAKLNAERQKKGESLYANPRNVAAGSVRQLDPKVTVIPRH